MCAYGPPAGVNAVLGLLKVLEYVRWRSATSVPVFSVPEWEQELVSLVKSWSKVGTATVVAERYKHVR